MVDDVIGNIFLNIFFTTKQKYAIYTYVDIVLVLKMMNMKLKNGEMSL